MLAAKGFILTFLWRRWILQGRRMRAYVASIQQTKRKKYEKAIVLSLAAVSLVGCYGYNTTRSIKSGDRECKYTLDKSGNMIFGYKETPFTNETRSEKECLEWLKK